MDIQENYKGAPELPHIVPVPLSDVVLGVDPTLGAGEFEVAQPNEPGTDALSDQSTEGIGVDEHLTTADADETEEGVAAAAEQPTRIAGVTVVPISDELLHHDVPSGQTYDNVVALERLHEAAGRNRAVLGINPNNNHGISDSRTAILAVWENPLDQETGLGGPSHNFFLNDGLLGSIRDATAQKGSDLTIDELAQVGLAETEGAVRPDFTADAMNDVNASYYASDVAFAPNTAPSGLYANNSPLNEALGTMLAHETGADDGSTLRVKELSSGGRTGHWTIVSHSALNAGAGNVDITLSDFVTPPIDPDIPVDHVQVSAEQYSLFDDMPPLPQAERHDAVITTYGFDSVWQEGDIHINKLYGDTYQTVFRVKVADWNPRKEELTAAMRAGQPLPNATASDYDGIVVESAMTPVDISTHPYAKYIEQHPRNTVIVPGGLIKRVVDAFENQLTDDGIFVSCDVGNFGKTEKRGGRSDSVSGIAARYHAADYVLAKNILEGEHGMEVTLMSLQELADGYLSEGWQASALPYDVENLSDLNNGVMIARRRRNS